MFFRFNFSTSTGKWAKNCRSRISTTIAAFSIALTDSELGRRSFPNVDSIASGRLSTQKYPRSSNAFVAELIPEPLNPVKITSREAAELDVLDRGISLGFDKPKIPVVAFINYRNPLRLGVAENKKIVFIGTQCVRCLLRRNRFDGVPGLAHDSP